MTTLAERCVINARLTGRLKAKGDMKRQEGLFDKPPASVPSGEMTGERAYELMKIMDYTGPTLPMIDLVQQAYPDHEIYIEMNDGTAFGIGTADSCVIIHYANSIMDLLLELAPGVGVADIAENRAQVYVPGMKNAYYVEC